MARYVAQAVGQRGVPLSVGSSSIHIELDSRLIGCLASLFHNVSERKNNSEVIVCITMII